MPRIIKRYDNRKLYDTETRQYVSLDEITGLIRQGVDVQVIENSTERDMTAQTLTQIILEEGKRGRNPFSKEALHEAIRWSNTLIGDGLAQVRRSLDHLVPDSMHRVLGTAKSEDIQQLKHRIELLERALNVLINREVAPDKSPSQSSE